MNLTSALSFTGEAAACMTAADRRHGEGQRTTNALFRQFVLNAIAQHGENAKKGKKHFELDPLRKKVMIAACLTELFACPEIPYI